MDEAERRIQEVARTGVIDLDLSGLGLTSLPESLRQLSQVQHLSINDNKLKTLPDLRPLSQLRFLFADRNQLTEFPALPDSLQHLDLSNNQLTSLPDTIGQLTQLGHLELGSNQLTALPQSIGQLQDLQTLNAFDNQLTALPPLPAKLQVLEISYNQLQALPESLGQLTQLQALFATRNELTLLPDAMGLLTELHTLHVNRNQLQVLPESLLQLSALKSLYLHGNEALGLPAEVLGPDWEPPEQKTTPASPAAILDYYFRLGRGRRALNEVKLIVVGRGGVGKTCIIKQLMHHTFDPGEPETPGIEISQWPVTLPGGDAVRLHIWDFGGQEILHATHQLFLTERTLYLVVLSGREGNPTQDAEYWLQLIKSFGGSSRVVIALNKSDQHPFDVNRGLLVEKYPFIGDFIKTGCAHDQGLPELTELLLRHTAAMEHRKTYFPMGWFAIKERLAGMAEKFITWEEYQTICCALGEQDPEAQRRLAMFLHILGIALNYGSEPRLKDTHVLNPRWVTEGIYSILSTGQKKKRDAILTRPDLGKILGDQSYPAECHGFLLHLMEKFELCFGLPGSEERYLIPELLGENQPDLREFLELPGLGFRYQHEVLPEGMLPRFIVQTHAYSAVSPQWRWRTGVVLHHHGCSAVVRADVRERRVDIHITGADAERRALLDIIRDKFEEQYRDLKGLAVDERVPIPGESKITVSYRDLVKREQRGEKTFYPENLDREVAVQELLNGVDSPERRAQRSQRGNKPTKG